MDINEYIESQHKVDITKLEIFIMYDQPPTCSKCYCRADILEDFIWNRYQTQLCQCNNKDCRFVFIEQEDDYFSIDYWMNESRFE